MRRSTYSPVVHAYLRSLKPISLLPFLDHPDCSSIEWTTLYTPNTYFSLPHHVRRGRTFDDSKTFA